MEEGLSTCQLWEDWNCYFPGQLEPRMSASTVLHVFALVLLLPIVFAGSRCQLLDWEVTYTSRERYLIDDFTDLCLERCRMDFGERCFRTEAWYSNERNIQCDAYVQDEGYKKDSIISVKLCRPQLPRCNSKGCNPCFPCRDGTLRNGACQHQVVRVRFGDRKVHTSNSVAECRQRCWSDPDCVWSLQMLSECTINVLNDNHTYISDSVLTLQDHSCLPPTQAPASDYSDI